MQGNSEFTMCYASHPAMKRALVLCGFITRGGRSMVVHPAASGLRREWLAQGDAWYVTALDSDADPIFHYGPYVQ